MMKSKKVNLFFLFVLMCTAFVRGELFKEIERVNFDYGETVFGKLADIQLVPDGFAIVIWESAHNRYSQALLKMDSRGKFVKSYNKRGNGPGEIRYIYNILVTEKAILACESVSPIIHQFDHNLNFEKDYKIKKGGKLLYLSKNTFAVQNLYFRNPNDSKAKVDIFALYNVTDFKFKKKIFAIDEVPFLVHTWGGLIPAGKDTYAGVFPTEYQVRIFDKDFNPVKNLINKTPDHFVRYHTFKKDQSLIDEQAHDWMNSWSKIESLFYVDNHYILKYFYKGKRFLDVIDQDGNIVVKNYKESDNASISLVHGSDIWLTTWEEIHEYEGYALVKCKLDLKK